MNNKNKIKIEQMKTSKCINSISKKFHQNDKYLQIYLTNCTNLEFVLLLFFYSLEMSEICIILNNEK